MCSHGDARLTGQKKNTGLLSICTFPTLAAIFRFSSRGIMAASLEFFLAASLAVPSL